MNCLTKLGLFLFVLFTAAPMNRAWAQESNLSKDFARNSVFLELLGNGGLYTLNYDHKFFDHASARIGFEFLPGLGADDTDDRISIFVAPIMINYLAGNGNSRLELGVGTYFAAVSGDVDSEVINAIGGGGLTGTIGYRLQPRDGGFLFRIGVTPLVSDGAFQFWGGLSLGVTF